MRSDASISEYRSRCAEYILNGFKYPRMYFTTLQELDWILFGHAVAHEQMGLITRDDAFNDSFGMWLYKTNVCPVNQAGTEPFKPGPKTMRPQSPPSKYG